MAVTETTSERTTPARGAGSFGGGKRWWGRANTAIAVFLAIYDVLVFNIIVYRHPTRIDLTEERLFSLSEETRKRLEHVNEEVKVIVSLYQQPGNALHQAYARVFQDALDVLKEFHAEQPLIDVVEKVNAFQEPDRWTEICRDFDLSPSQFNRIIFVAGEGEAHRRALSPNEIADLEPSRDPSIPPRIREFRGEEAMAATITSLTERDRRVVYFTTGHGELALGPKEGQPPALAVLRSDLESSGFEARELALIDRTEVPADAELLAIVGPRERFSPDEIDRVESWLEADGRLFVALGPHESGLEDLLEAWGTRVLPGELLMRRTLPGELVERSWVRIGEFNGGQPVTAPFVNTPSFHMLLLSPRALEVEPGRKNMVTEPLVSTGSPSDTVRFVLAGGAETDAPVDTERGWVLATASHGVAPSRPPPGFVPRNARIVVVGAASFLRDFGGEQSLQGGYLNPSWHRDFFMNCARWLVDKESLMSVSGRSTQTRTLPALDGGLQRFLFVASVLIFPGIFGLIGVAVYFLRRS